MHNLCFHTSIPHYLNKSFTLFARKTLPSSISLREISMEHIFAFAEAMYLTVTITNVTSPRLFEGLYHSLRKHCVYSKVCSITCMDIYLIVPP